MGVKVIRQALLGKLLYINYSSAIDKNLVIYSLIYIVCISSTLHPFTETSSKVWPLQKHLSNLPVQALLSTFHPIPGHSLSLSITHPLYSSISLVVSSYTPSLSHAIIHIFHKSILIPSHHTSIPPHVPCLIHSTTSQSTSTAVPPIPNLLYVSNSHSLNVPEL